MQPYFVPYLGYFQLIEKCNSFVIYDDVQYTKKGWINRNRLRDENLEWTVSMSLSKSPEKVLIKEKSISPTYDPGAILARIHSGYRRSEFYSENIELIEALVTPNSSSLFSHLKNSIQLTLDYLDIETELLTSSEVTPTSKLKGQEKIFALAKHLGVSSYLNPISGRNLYRTKDFSSRSMNLHFFIPAVQDLEFSIVDALLRYGRIEVKKRSRDGRISLTPPNGH